MCMMAANLKFHGRRGFFATICCFFHVKKEVETSQLRAPIGQSGLGTRQKCKERALSVPRWKSPIKSSWKSSSQTGNSRMTVAFPKWAPAYRNNDPHQNETNQSPVRLETPTNLN